MSKVYMTIAAITLMLTTTLISSAHGGISALDGLFEVMIMMAILAAITLAWFGFIMVLIFAKQVNSQTFSRFRKITYLLLLLFGLIVVFLVVKGGLEWGFLIMALTIMFSLFIITEISIFSAKKARKMNS